MSQTTNLNMIPQRNVRNMYFSQNDVGRVVTVNLVDGETPYSIPSGATVKIQATKPSGLGFSETCTFSGSTVTVTSTATMTDEAGIFPCEIQVTNSGVILGSANFNFFVERNPHPDGTTDGTAESVVNEITVALQNALDDIEAKGDEVIESIPQDYTELSNDVDDLKDDINNINTEIFNYESVSFSHNIGAGLTRTSPWFGTAKYGIKAKASLSSLSFAFDLALRYTSATVKYQLKDEDGNVYAETTDSYTTAQAGDSASVSLNFTFNPLLPAGQYYLWIYAYTASSMGYGYSSGTFPSYTYIALTNDGGYSGSKDATSLTSYAMYLNVAITGTAVLTDSKMTALMDALPLAYSNPSLEIEQNSWSGENGNSTTNANRCRTVGYVKRGQIIITNAPYVMFVLAYDKDDTYIGYWKRNTWSTSYNSGTDFIYSTQVFDVDDFATRYPDYKFKLDFLSLPTSEIAPATMLLNVKAVSHRPQNTYSCDVSKLIYGFTDVGVCGDSLCVGTTLNAGGTTIVGSQWSWPHRLAVSSGNNWEVFAKAGLTTVTWLTDSNGFPALQATNKKQLYIISLGVNDATGSNYETALATNYATLLDTIHAYAPDAILMCVPLWSFASSRPIEYNTVSEIIDTCCSSRSYAYFVDLSDADSTLKGNYFATIRVSAHYNSLAYSMIADIIAHAIGKVIYENPNDFKYIDFIDIT